MFPFGQTNSCSGANIAMFMLRAAGDARQSMLAFMAGTVVTLVLQPGLILGLGGTPTLGLSGAALVIGRASTLLIALAFMAGRRASVGVSAAAIAADRLRPAAGARGGLAGHRAVGCNGGRVHRGRRVAGRHVHAWTVAPRDRLIQGLCVRQPMAVGTALY